MDFLNNPHRRLNPLTGEWVMVSPHRLRRPWDGKIELIPRKTHPSYDPNCYLCPGNTRAGGKVNPDYETTFVFENDFSALLTDIEEGSFAKQNLLIARAERGTCQVVCFSPRHNLTLAEMDEGGIRTVVDVWAEEFQRLSNEDHINYVQIFENKGEMMGCSNPHPHGQIWATESLPVEPSKEHDHQQLFHEENGGKCLLCEYLKIELAEKERIVCENENWVALVPFWAVWPYETMVLPKSHLPNLAALDDNERNGLANVLKRITTRYDNLFKVSFPYTMGFHQEPTDAVQYPFWHLHLHFYPPLLRSATVKKFMVGYEMLATPQRDITAELSAEKLRDLPEQRLV